MGEYREFPEAGGRSCNSHRSRPSEWPTTWKEEMRDDEEEQSAVSRTDLLRNEFRH